METAMFEKITPEKAADYLEKNTKRNRKVANRRVHLFARDMASGRWVSNGEPIIFDKSGELIDGQHRLLAIIEAGIPVKMLVVRGVPKKAFETIDQGSSRTLAVVLGSTGVQASSARAACTFDKTGSVEIAARARAEHKPTTAELVEWYTANEDTLQSYVLQYGRLRRVVGKLSSVATIVALRAADLRGINIDGFVDDLCSALTPGATQRACVFAKVVSRYDMAGHEGRIKTAQLLLWLADCYEKNYEPARDRARYFDVSKFDRYGKLPL